MTTMTHVARACAAALLACLGTAASAEILNRGREGPPLSELREAPAALRDDLPVIVASPSPSDVNASFLGQHLMLRSGHVDMARGTVTLPLRRGRMASGETVWFILTDSDNEHLANLMGLVHAPKLGFAEIGRAVREATIERDGTWVFPRGRVDFAPRWSITPGAAPNPFPPRAAQPGSVGDEWYTPLVRTTNSGRHLYNAPVVAFNVSEEQLNRFCDGNPNHDLVHDKVARICPRDGTVDITLTLGYSFGRPIWYLSTEANDPVVATLEQATLAPAMGEAIATLEDSQPGSGAERIQVIVNGPTGTGNPQRQGIFSALTDGRGPINVLGGIPTINLDYSPIWSIEPVVWTDEAIQRGYRARITSAIETGRLNRAGWVRGLMGPEVQKVGFLVNCPVVLRIE